MIAAALLIVGGVGGLVGCWQYGEYVKRRDYRDRARTGKLWRWFDGDAWESRAWRSAGVVMFVVGVGSAAVVSPGVTATVAVAAISAVALRRRFRRSGGQLRYDPVVHHDGREQIVYAFGGFDHLDGTLRCIKFGITVRGDEVRCAEVDDREQTVNVQILATGPGGKPREDTILDRLDEWRYPRSEWFAVSPDTLDEVALLENPTHVGRRVLRRSTT